MPDQPDQPEQPEQADRHDSPLDPAVDARIRGLLADARHTAPMPPEVAARMDRVLEGLATERAPVAPVVDLARRRRTAARLLVAAAAVVVAGVGVGQVLPHLGGSGDDQATAGSAESAYDSADGSGGGSGSKAPEAAPADGVTIHRATFGADVRRIRARIESPQDSQRLMAAPAETCLTTAVRSGTVLAATYDGAAAALVLNPPVGDSQVVDLYLCGTDNPARSITLPAR